MQGKDLASLPMIGKDLNDFTHDTILKRDYKNLHTDLLT